MRNDLDPPSEIRSSRGSELDGRLIVHCITGSVAAMEAPSLARELIRHGAEVYTVMSKAAKKLITPDLLEWATGNKPITSLTGRSEHVRLAGELSGRADLILIAPCTANTISKIALGIDDTPVTTFASMALGSGIPIIVCPAAHEPMYRNPSVISNLERLKQLSVEVIEPRIEEGKAKMASNEIIVSSVIRALSRKDLSGKSVIVTGGPTVEFIDPVRVITNLSSGKMGVALAEEAWRRGAKVTYIHGGELIPHGRIERIKVSTTEEMLREIIQKLETSHYDILISAAAPADFTPLERREEKISSREGEIILRLRPTRKIINEVRSKWKDIFIVAFKAETTTSMEELEKKARELMNESNIEMVVANSVGEQKVFGSDYNEVLIVTKRGKIHIERDLKENIARKIIDEMVRLISGA